MDFQSEKSFRKLRLRAFQPYHQMLYMSTLSTLGISISIAFNAIYVDTVELLVNKPSIRMYILMLDTRNVECSF